jgi:hypothetical protein
MRFRIALAVVCAVMLCGVVIVRGDDEKKDAPEKAAAKGKLVQPWSKLSDLSDEQKNQLREIHAKAMAEIKAIKEKEQTDSMAVLTDAQKAELAAISEKATVEKKTKSAKNQDEEKKEPAPAQ